MATAAIPTRTQQQANLQVFLQQIEQLVMAGFKGALTLQCPGDGTVRSMEERKYHDLESLRAKHDER